MKTTYKQCHRCPEFNDVNLLRCCRCDVELMGTLASNQSAVVHSFRSGWYEHIDADPIYIHSRKQLKEETIARGLTSKFIHWSPSSREVREGKFYV